MISLQDDRRFAEAQTGPSELTWNQCGKIASVREGPDELVWVGTRSIELAPIGIRESTAEISDGRSEVLMQLTT